MMPTLMSVPRELISGILSEHVRGATCMEALLWGCTSEQAFKIAEAAVTATTSFLLSWAECEEAHDFAVLRTFAHPAKAALQLVETSIGIQCKGLGVAATRIAEIST